MKGSINVLIIEDNNDHWLLMRMAIQTAFSQAMVTRIVSFRAEEFLRDCLIEQWNIPRLILMDLYFPNLENGLALANRIKLMTTSCELIPIPIIALSSFDTRADIVKAYQVGISSLCLKPISFDAWIDLFKGLSSYWLETVTLPSQHYSLFQ